MLLGGLCLCRSLGTGWGRENVTRAERGFQNGVAQGKLRWHAITGGLEHNCRTEIGLSLSEPDVPLARYSRETLLDQAALRRPLLEQDQALPVQPALEVAEQLIPFAGRRAIEFLLDQLPELLLAAAVASQRIQARDDAGFGSGDSPLPWTSQSKNTVRIARKRISRRVEMGSP